LTIHPNFSILYTRGKEYVNHRNPNHRGPNALHLQENGGSNMWIFSDLLDYQEIRFGIIMKYLILLMILTNAALAADYSICVEYAKLKNTTCPITLRQIIGDNLF
jgi:hypothetical protein